MTEEILASVKANPHVWPQLSVWGWQITVYFVLNGLAAGALILSSVAVLSRRELAVPFTACRLPLIGVAAIMVAMTALSLDLERIPMAWRFFTSLEMSSSMSRGTWALMVVIPVLILLALAQLEKGYPPLARLLRRLPLVGRLAGWIMAAAHRWRWWLALAGVLLGIDLGLHTGVLLASINARPFWHSNLMPPLMLAMALVSGAAMVMLAATQAEERRLVAWVTVAVIVAELVLIALFVELMHSGAALQQQAVHHVLGGETTRLFWGGVVGFGLLLPLLLALVVAMRPWMPLAMIAAVLLLGGSGLLSQITLDLGQRTSWTQVRNQFNPELLKLLTSRPGAAHGQ